MREATESSFDEIDEVAAGLPIGPAEVIFVEIHLRLVQSFGELLSSSSVSGFIVSDLSE